MGNNAARQALSPMPVALFSFNAPRVRRLIYTFGPALFLIAWLLRREIVRCGGLYAASDDSYIYLGYVKRAMTLPRELFSYNIGEHSAGTTGILYYYCLLVVCSGVRLVTWTLPLDVSLRVGMYVLNIGLFLAVTGCFASIVRRINAPTDEQLGPVLALALAVVFSHSMFLWGAFCGLENPLSALLVLLLIHSILADAPAWRSSALAAMLCATRPELTTVVVAAPAFAALRHTRRPGGPVFVWLGESVRPLLVGYVTYALVLGALVLPCYLTSGRVFPSALGSRLTIAAVIDPRLLWDGVRKAFDATGIWRSDWAIWNYLIVACLLCLAPTRKLGAALWPNLFVTAFLYARAVLGLTDFNIHDRYFSYLWPVYALGLSSILFGAVSVALEHTNLLKNHVLKALVSMAVIAGAFRFGVTDFLDTYAADVDEMNQVVVEPAKWMQANLPPHSRVSMEPAGALRVFTDFYLVDAVGLTTTHSLKYRSYADFMQAHRVDFAFDYPGRIRELANTAVFENIKSWSPQPRRYSLGQIGVFRLRPNTR